MPQDEPNAWMLLLDAQRPDRSPDPSPSAGSCFGYGVHGSLRFHYLRGGGGLPIEVLEASEAPPEPNSPPLMRWVARPHNPFSARVHETEAGYSVWVDGGSWYGVDPVRRRVWIASRLPAAREQAGLWAIPAGLLMRERGDLPLHAASVEVGGRALVLAGPSRFGKTTLASAFLGRGCRLLSEDLTCCTPAVIPAVLPGPALLRVRADSYQRLGFPGTHPVFQAEDRIYLELDEDARGSGGPVPLLGIVFLRTGNRRISLRRVDLHRALPDLWTLSFKFSSDADRTRCFHALSDLAMRVPIWNLYRPLNFGRTEAVVDRLIGLCNS